MKKKDEIDNLLESALASYSAVEPRPGLEQRVIARIPERTSFRFAPWAFAIPALACVIFFFINRTQPPSAEPLAKAPAIIAPPAEPVRVATVLPRTRKEAVPVRKQDTFPAPAPLTREELALLQLVTRAPEQAKGLAVEFAATTTIEPIRLEPMTDLRRENDEE